MRLADFDYELPDERIAQHPLEPRDSARLLVDQGSASPLHRQVSDIGEYLREGDLLVVNDTKVIPARLRLHRESGRSTAAPASVTGVVPNIGGSSLLTVTTTPASRMARMGCSSSRSTTGGAPGRRWCAGRRR